MNMYRMQMHVYAYVLINRYKHAYAERLSHMK